MELYGPLLDCQSCVFFSSLSIQLQGKCDLNIQSHSYISKSHVSFWDASHKICNGKKMHVTNLYLQYKEFHRWCVCKRDQRSLPPIEQCIWAYLQQLEKRNESSILLKTMYTTTFPLQAGIL